jgi:type I restriction enzyme S subunit
MNLKTSKLGDVCDIRSGNSIPAKEKDDLYRNVSEGLPYVATKDIGFDGSINFENGVKIPAKLSKRFRLSEKNSVLVCAEGGSAGRKIAYSNQDCYFVNKLFSIKPKTEIDSKYIYFYTLSNEFQKKFKESLHGLIGGVSLSKIKNFQITYPPFAEQQRIVAKLDAAFAEIDKAIVNNEKTLSNIKKFNSKIFDKLLSKIECKKVFLNDICKVERGSSPRPIKSFLTKEKDGVNWIKIGDAKSDEKYIYSTKQKITKDGAKQSRIVKKGDFVLTNSMSYGRPYIMSTNGCIHDGWFVLRLEDDVDSDYFYYLLSSEGVQNQFKFLAAGSVVKNISGDLVKKTTLLIPSKKKQLEIREKLSTIIQYIKRINKLTLLKIKNYQKLKQLIIKNLTSLNTKET